MTLRLENFWKICHTMRNFLYGFQGFERYARADITISIEMDIGIAFIEFRDISQNSVIVT